MVKDFSENSEINLYGNNTNKYSNYNKMEVQ
jgi:hypothetical protein